MATPEGTFDPGRGSVPNPDPTLLTTEALLREIENLDKLSQARIEIVQNAVNEARLDVNVVAETAAVNLEALRVKQDERSKTAEARVEEQTYALQQQIRSVNDALAQRITFLTAALDERYATQSKALDAAFIVADKAVVAALESAEKAVAKAEIANEKRFDAMLSQLGGIITRLGELVPRTEADVAHKSIEGKLVDNINRSTERFNDITHRLDSAQGVISGSAGRDQKTMSVIGAIAAAFSILVAIGALIAVIVR